MCGSAPAENSGQQQDFWRNVYAVSGEGFVLAGRRTQQHRNAKNTASFCLVLEDRLASEAPSFLQRSKLLSFECLAFYLWFEFIYFCFPQNQNRTTSGSGFPTHAANCHPQSNVDPVKRDGPTSANFHPGHAEVTSHGLRTCSTLRSNTMCKCTVYNYNTNLFTQNIFIERLWIKLTKKKKKNRRET